MAAFIHGKSSDLLIDEKGYRGQLASDLLNLIPSVIQIMKIDLIKLERG